MLSGVLVPSSTRPRRSRQSSDLYLPLLLLRPVPQLPTRNSTSLRAPTTKTQWRKRGRRHHIPHSKAYMCMQRPRFKVSRNFSDIYGKRTHNSWATLCFHRRSWDQSCIPVNLDRLQIGYWITTKASASSCHRCQHVSTTMPHYQSSRSLIDTLSACRMVRRC